MPADTLNEMILGFTVILGVLLGYALTLYIRIRQAESQKKETSEE